MKTRGFFFAVCLLAYTGWGWADDAVHVSVQPPEGPTGTMHYSAVLGLQLGDTRPVFLKTNVERGVLAPSEVLLTKSVGKDAWAVIAYSSMGGGNETLHVILLTTVRHATVMTDQLKMNVGRGSGGFLWTEGGELFAVQPEESRYPDDVFLESTHAALPYSEIGRLKFVDRPPAAAFISGLSRYFAQPASPSLKAVKIPFSNGRFDLPGIAGKKK